MKKVFVMLIISVLFSFCRDVYGLGRVFIFKGTIKASNTIFDVNDTNNLTSATVKSYIIVDTVADSSAKGYVNGSSAIFYDPRQKYYKIIYGSVTIEPYDPCRVVMMSFSATDVYGNFSFDAVGKGQLTKYSAEAGVAKDYFATSLKGSGLFSSYEFFDPNYIYTGPVTVSLKLDTKWTCRANDGDYNDVVEITDAVLNELTGSGGWTQWEHLLPP